MFDERLPSDIDPASRCRLPPPIAKVSMRARGKPVTFSPIRQAGHSQDCADPAESDCIARTFPGVCVWLIPACGTRM